MDSQVVQFGVRRLKEMAKLRSPRYELPADSHLENAVADIAERALHHVYEVIRSVRERVDAEGDILTEAAHAAHVALDDLIALLPEEQARR